MRKLIALLVLAFAATFTAEAKVVTLQVTIGASATALTTGNVYCRWIVFQNNAGHTMRIGDSNVSSTRGILLASGSPGGSFFQQPFSTGGLYNLNGWYVSGTQNDVIDVIYDDGQ